MGGKPTNLAANSSLSTISSSSSTIPRHFNGGRNEIQSPSSSGSSIDSVFGSAPTRLEAEYAITAFQSFMMEGLSSSMSILNRLHSLSNHNDPTIVHSTGFQRVYDAFRLLQTVSSVRKMVISISTDRTVWDAVMKNTEVQEFRHSLDQAKANRAQRFEEEPDLVSIILKWILDNMKLKVMELIEILKSVISKSFESAQIKSNNTELKHGFEEMIVSTVLLSTITLMIVLVTRAYGA